MKRRISRAAFVFALFALIAAFAAPAAEAGRRHRYRARYVAPSYTYRAHHVYRPYHGVYSVRVRTAPVVVPVVPYRSYYRGPGVYIHGFVR